MTIKKVDAKQGFPSPLEGEGCRAKHLNFRNAGEGFCDKLRTRGHIIATTQIHARAMDREFARKLRRDQTDVERKLWYALRDRRFRDFKFRRQQLIGAMWSTSSASMGGS